MPSQIDGLGSDIETFLIAIKGCFPLLSLHNAQEPSVYMVIGNCMAQSPREPKPCRSEPPLAYIRKVLAMGEI